MPSYKQKKRHRTSENGGSDSDSIGNLWKVQYSDSDSEDANEGKRLTSLVRESYVKHLRYILKTNYDVWRKSQSEDIADSSSIYHWATILEQKALRACMVAELYQKSMISLISEIKKNTSESKLYFKRNDLLASEKLLPKEVGIQTDETEEVPKKQCCDSETQTMNKGYSSVLEMPLPKCDKTSSPAVLGGQPIPTIDQLRDCIAKVSPVPRSVVITSPWNEHLVSEHNLNSKLKECSDASALKQTSGNNSIPNSESPEVESHLNSSGLGLLTLPHKQGTSTVSSESFNSPASVRNKRMTSTLSGQSAKIDSDKVRETLVTKQQNVNQISESDFLADLEQEIQCLSESGPVNNGVSDNTANVLGNNSVRETNDSYSETDIKDSLDARLTAMGLLGDTESNTVQSPNRESKTKSNWRAEYIAQSCNLTRILSRLSIERRKYVQRKMLQLFGPMDDSVVEMCEENVTVCRKRIASVVVNELTPLYQANRISSKYLFKHLAKRLTASLMQTSYAPETRYVKKCVHEFFRDKKCISSDKDIMFI